LARSVEPPYDGACSMKEAQMVRGAVRAVSLPALVIAAHLLAVPGARAQSADASLCKLMPVPSIEKLLGGQASKPVGMDVVTNIGNCSVSVGNPNRMVIVSTAPITGQGNVVERTKLGVKLMEGNGRMPKSKATYQYFGDTVCSSEEISPPYKQTTCMTDHGKLQYNLVVRSDNATHTRVEGVKQLLKEMVAKAK